MTAAPAPPPQDPLFFAEEFAARRRRYIPVNLTSVLTAGTQGVYKNYNFPFITKEELDGKEDDYPALFKAARLAQFTEDKTGYTPTTRFEAMTFEAYKRAIAEGVLEKIRNLFVDSLLKPNLLVDMSRFQSRPAQPVGSGEFAIPKKAEAGAKQAYPTGVPSSRTVSDDLKIHPSILLAHFIAFIIYLIDYIRRGSATQIHVFMLLAAARKFALELTQHHLFPSILPRLNRDISRLTNILGTIQNNDRLTKLADIIVNSIEELLRQAHQNSQAAVAEAIRTKAPPINYQDEFNADVDNWLQGFLDTYNPGANDPTNIPSDMLDSADDTKVADFGQAQLYNIPGPPVESVITDLQATMMSLVGQLNTPPLPPHKTHGYLSSDFVAYLGRIASANPASTDPTLCQQVFFKDDQSEKSEVYIDMLPFTKILSPSSFGVPSDPQYTSRLQLGQPVVTDLGCVQDADPSFKGVDPALLTRSNALTIEDAYDRLKIMKGTAIERYVAFISFIYLFFDHIPATQRVVTALITPLYVMHWGILLRAHYSDENSILRMVDRRLTPNEIVSSTVFDFAETAFDEQATRTDAIRAVIEMYRYHRSSRVAIQSLIGTLDNINDTGYIHPTRATLATIRTSLLTFPIKDGPPLSIPTAKKVYKNCGLIEFDLPSIGEAHMILPLLLGLSRDDIRTLIYNLTARWFNSLEEYQQTLMKIYQVSAEYYRLSRGRSAYTDAAGLSVAQTTLPGIVRILPPSPTYIDPTFVPQPAKEVTPNTVRNFLPHSWDELLYPAYVSHAVVESQLLREIAQTLVRPCLQDASFSISFPSRVDVVPGSMVEVLGVDIDRDPEIFSAIFEFPSEVISIILSAGSSITPGSLSLWALSWFPGIPTPAAGLALGQDRYKLQRTSTPTAFSGPIYQMVHSLSIANAVPSIIAQSTRPPTNSFTPTYILQNRTHYAWAIIPQPPTTGKPALQFSTPASGEVEFLPALDTELFLSSLFDWKLQLYYLKRLQNFLADRTSLALDLAKVNQVMAAIPFPVDEDNGGAQAYIRNSSLTNLISGPLPYAGLRNLIFNIAGPIASANLSDILKAPEIINSFNLSIDTRRFYITQLPTPLRGPLNYDIDIDDYLTLLVARSKSIAPLVEKEDEAAKRIAQEKKDERDRSIASLIQKSGQRLKDPYSILIDDIVTRAIYTRPSE